jgi:hypothetical protein
MTVFELLTETAKADRDLLIKNDEAGDDFNKQREVDFSFETSERERANDFAEIRDWQKLRKGTSKRDRAGAVLGVRADYNADQSKHHQLRLWLHALPESLVSD